MSNRFGWMEKTGFKGIGRQVASVGGVLLLLSVLCNIAQAQQLNWAKQTKGEGDSWAHVNGIAVDSAGNSYVTGDFSDTVTFGAGEANETTLITTPDYSFFIAKYSGATGQLLWAKQAGGGWMTRGEGIAVDSAGNIYVTGFFIEDATFGAGEANETTLTWTGDWADIFVAKYDGITGQLLWVKMAGGIDSAESADYAWGIAVGSTGNIYVTGGFSYTVTFGAGEANETSLTNIGAYDSLFVANYNGTNGQLDWAKQAGGEGDFPWENDIRGFGIAVDSAGNIYVTGEFTGTIVFGAGEVNESTLTSSSGDYTDCDSFVAKYNGTTGQLVWAKQAGGVDWTSGQGITVDSAGNSYVTGYFTGTTIFGAGEANETTLTSDRYEESEDNFWFTNALFVAKYNSSGELTWVKQAGGAAISWDAIYGQGIAVDSAGNTYVTGDFSGTVTFGAGEANETTLTGDGFFVARYSSSGELTWVKQAGGGESYAYANGIAVDSAGNGYVTGDFTGTVTFGAGGANGTTLTSASGSDVFVAKWTFTTDAPDTTPPAVISTIPANGTTGNSISTPITVNFSEVMDAETITSATFTVRSGSTDVPGTVSYSGTTATFTPAGNWAYSTSYTAMVTTGARDLAGNALASNYIWNFDTGSALDTTPPTVVSTNPLKNATGVAVNASISVTFSEEMDASSIVAAAFILTGGGNNLPCMVNYSGAQATFTPTSTLASNTTYTATMTTLVEDVAGNPMAGNYTWAFTTETEAEPTLSTSGGGGGGGCSITPGRKANDQFPAGMILALTLPAIILLLRRKFR